MNFIPNCRKLLMSLSAGVLIITFGFLIGFRTPFFYTAFQLINPVTAKLYLIDRYFIWAAVAVPVSYIVLSLLESRDAQPRKSRTKNEQYRGK